MGWSKDMLVIDILEAEPKTEAVLLSFGLPCGRCVVAEFETLAEGARAYGIPVETIIEKLDRLAPQPTPKAKK